MIPPTNATGMNTEQSTSTIATARPLTCCIALSAAIARRNLLLRHDALDVLDHDDRVVDHDADREHEAEQREQVDREAEQPTARGTCR